HRARFTRDTIQELYVSSGERQDDGHLVPIWSHPSTSQLTEYLERFGVALQEGQIVEISLDAIDWLERLSHVLEKGLIVTIDYGERVQDLYTPDRKSGTLRCFHQHELSDNPFDWVGDQDITSSINFTALIEYGRDYGFEFLRLERQASF